MTSQFPAPDEDLEAYANEAATLLLGTARAVTLRDTELRRDLTRRLVGQIPEWVSCTIAAHLLADLAALITAPTGADPAELLVEVAAVKQGLRLPPSSGEARP
ncbi:hypothetical protein Psed_0868 [Pseudonocardia dioxanivorans CB1190]|uniref:Uncharacterized protein n=1 Tax=Pseudonocardia dioxanivorans (strain ATCC 55486 / DSM 44775 / JCM 13855 / CB1190) TaxID=675635 RepID=F4CSE8_PSEUX|nr:hypothetical protein [Pseudonocardia dioxanivorans]AEA23122.1 hypothetical protein Psed_0868 [Pseudonocardia dioxanivorans CB1190]